MRVEIARRRLPALSALQRSAVCRARAERAKAEIVPERPGVLVGLCGGQERRVCVVGAAGYVAHRVVYGYNHLTFTGNWKHEGRRVRFRRFELAPRALRKEVATWNRH